MTEWQEALYLIGAVGGVAGPLFLLTGTDVGERILAGLIIGALFLLCVVAPVAALAVWLVNR